MITEKRQRDTTYLLSCALRSARAAVLTCPGACAKVVALACSREPLVLGLRRAGPALRGGGVGELQLLLHSKIGVVALQKAVGRHPFVPAARDKEEGGANVSAMGDARDKR